LNPAVEALSQMIQPRRKDRPFVALRQCGNQGRKFDASMPKLVDEGAR
jgi:hypothetical protein